MTKVLPAADIVSQNMCMLLLEFQAIRGVNSELDVGSFCHIDNPAHEFLSQMKLRKGGTLPDYSNSALY